MSFCSCIWNTQKHHPRKSDEEKHEIGGKGVESGKGADVSEVLSACQLSAEPSNPKSVRSRDAESQNVLLVEMLYSTFIGEPN